MAFQAVPDTAQIDMVYTLNGEPAQNSFYARLQGGYGLADLQALADVIDAVFLTTFVTEQPAESIYLRTDVRGLASENDLVATQNAGTGAGTHPSSALPNNVTFSIKKSSPFTGRSARGRTFWIGVPNNEVLGTDDNLVTQTWADQVVADIDFVRTQTETVGVWEAVLVSRFANGAKRAMGVTFPWVTTSAVNLVVDTNRGRLPSS